MQLCLSFHGRRINSGCLHRLFAQLFAAQRGDFKNLKGIWHQMLSCSRQLQGIFGFLKPLFYAQIWLWNVSVSKNDVVSHNVVQMANTLRNKWCFGDLSMFSSNRRAAFFKIGENALKEFFISQVLQDVQTLLSELSVVIIEELHYCLNYLIPYGDFVWHI